MAGAGQAGGHTYVWKDALRAFDVHAEMTLNDTVGVFLGLISAVSPAERDQLSRRFVDSQIERKTALLQSVGSEEQAKDLIQYIQDGRKQEEGIWQINIFGKTIEELVEDGIRSKLYQIGEESQVKLQDTMQKIVNDSNGGLVCIII